MAKKKGEQGSSRGVQLNTRLTAEEWNVLTKLVEAANKKARQVGLPDEVTAASLIRMWVREKGADLR
jgi:hypothetical protein